MIIRFFIYGLVGWLTEILWTGFGSLMSGDFTMRGWTYIWMFPIYGLLLFLERVHDHIRHLPVVVRGGIYALLILTTEFITGWLLQELIGECPWCYGDGPYTIYGIINLAYIPVWSLAGLAFEKLHDYLIAKEISSGQ